MIQCKRFSSFVFSQAARSEYIKKLNAIIEDLEIDKNNIEFYFIKHNLFDFKVRKVKNKNKNERKKVSPIANRTFAGILAGNKINNDGIKNLCGFFTENNTLKYLDVGKNTFNDQGFEYFA